MNGTWGHHGIPTTYKSVRYRSRLEAKWAAFFDLVGWDYEYEPFDLDGWIPDFALVGKPDPVLVEVKPVFEFPEELGARLDGTTGLEILILGAHPFDGLTEGYCDSPRLGWLGEAGPEQGGEHWWDEAALVRYSLEPVPGRHGESGTGAPGRDPIGFAHSLGRYTDRMTGLYAGGRLGGIYCDEARALWAKAGNSVQWKRSAA